MTKRLTVWLISCFQLEKNKTTIRTEVLAMGYTDPQALAVVFVSDVLFITRLGISLGVTPFDDLNFDIAVLFNGPNPVNSIRSAFMLVISFSLVNMFYSIGGLLRQAAFSSQLL